LRWAILENNANGGGNRIQISPTGNPHKDWVIQVNSLLPAIKGPAVIEGKSWGNHDSPEVIIDGSTAVDERQSTP